MLSDQILPLRKLEDRVPSVRVFADALEAIVGLVEPKVAGEGHELGQDEEEVGQAEFLGAQVRRQIGENVLAEVSPLLGVISVGLLR